MDKKKRYKKGYFVGIGIIIGLPIGVPIGLVIGNIALGFSAGLPIGITIGIILEKKLNPNPIPLTPEEKKKQTVYSWLGVITGLILLAIISLFYFKII